MVDWHAMTMLRDYSQVCACMCAHVAIILYLHTGGARDMQYHSNSVKQIIIYYIIIIATLWLLRHEKLHNLNNNNCHPPPRKTKYLRTLQIPRMSTHL